VLPWLLGIFCPVDIRVYDSHGRFVGGIIDNVPSNVETSEIFAYVIDDAKYFFLPGGMAYTVRIRATDYGTMRIMAETLGGLSDTSSEMKTFENVALSPGREFVSEIVDTWDVRLFVVENGQIVGEIATDGTETGLSSLPFTDVRPTDWFYDAVRHVFQNNLMVGTSSTTFDPHMGLSRAMVATILARLETGGDAPVSTDQIFSDVPMGQWYFNAVNWASARGIVNGMGDGTFRPHYQITREQLATMLHRFAVGRGYDVTVPGHITAPEGGNIWGQEPMRWAIYNNFISGTDPQTSATRAETANFLHQFALRYGY